MTENETSENIIFDIIQDIPMNREALKTALLKLERENKKEAAQERKEADIFLAG